MRRIFSIVVRSYRIAHDVSDGAARKMSYDTRTARLRHSVSMEVTLDILGRYNPSPPAPDCEKCRIGL
jgi:hypothetical protein